MSPYSLNTLPAPAEGMGLVFGVGGSIRGVKGEVAVKMGVGNQSVTREEVMGTVGFEAGIDSLEEVEGGKVYAKPSWFADRPRGSLEPSTGLGVALGIAVAVGAGAYFANRLRRA